MVARREGEDENKGIDKGRLPALQRSYTRYDLRVAAAETRRM